MSDSEDENYVKFGAPLEPLDADNLPRKRAITAADQCVYDAEGRRRFHGAFTGGFSAGYFNGVGSRDGWTPKRFKSSRAERTVGVVQRPQDFMDEEDTGQFGIAPTAIRTTEGYQNLNKERSDASRRRQAQNDLLFQDGPIPGAPVLGEVLRPARDTVGVLLLKKMGWRPGQGVGARVTRKEKLEIRRRNKRMKVYGCARPPGEESFFSGSTDESANDEDAEDEDEDDENSTVTFAPDDYEPFRRVPKDNLFGIGYTGLDRRTVLSDSCDKRALLAESFFRQEKDRKIAKHGRAFGVGAFEEEDEDIYAPDDMSRYDFTLAPENAGKKSTRTKQHVPSGAAPCLEGFIKANYVLHQPEAAIADSTNLKTSKPRKFFPPPILPADFNPVHATSRFSPSVSSAIIAKRPISNASDRALMLDEQSSSTLTTNQRKTAESFEGRKEERKSESKNVASWLDKLQGGQAFVTGGLLTKPGNVTAEEEEKEKETTSKLDDSNFSAVEDSVEDSRKKAARLKMFGTLTRERREWRACSIVCKRFNIQEHKGDTKLESGMQKRPVKFSLLSKSIDFLSAAEGKTMSVLPAKAAKTEKTEMQLVEEANNLQNQENENVDTKAPPSADLTLSSQVSAPTPFEVSYEKIFGKTISGAEVGKNNNESSERKDLFKAIFLDSDSDDDGGGDGNEKKGNWLNEEKDIKKRNDEKIDEEEAMKSVLIGSVVETKPSFSPPSGIFSNLDKLERPKQDKKPEALQSATEKESDDKSKTSLNVPTLEALPENTYGPALPTTLTNNHCEDQKVETTNRQVFKSVVIPSRSGSMAEERWVEVKRSKKSKKEKKKKKKHKESKKSKKESTRRKRH